MPDKHEVGGSSPLGPTNMENKSKTQFYGGVAQLGEHLPCKQGVMGSNPIISTKKELQYEVSLVSFLYKESNTQMFIENRINKRNETDSCILRKTCY